MKRVIIGLIGALVLLLLVGASLYIYPVENFLFRHMADRAVSKPATVLAAPRQLSVLLCGTGTPLPDKSRAGPCTLIAAGDKYYLVDAGIDTARNLRLWQIPMEKIAGILITHFHSDHIAELGEMRLQTWASGRKTPLPVYGPPGVERVVAGFNEAYALDAGYRTAHHGAKMLPPDAVAMIAKPIAFAGATGPVLKQNGLTITAIRVHHDPATPAYGYRFDFSGRSIVVSGDTIADQNLAHAAKGVDVLVHEALSPEMVGALGAALAAHGQWRSAKIMHDIPAYHTSPVDAARIANEAGARLLVYTHLLPVLPDELAERLFLRGVSDVRSDGVIVGKDGLLIRLGAGSKKIEQSMLE
ncbi:MAG TPA: MBL fold metallo-hydrolase [Rhizomicrobium sp.]|jgi:ribonuclease Z